MTEDHKALTGMFEDEKPQEQDIAQAVTIAEAEREVAEEPQTEKHQIEEPQSEPESIQEEAKPAERSSFVHLLRDVLSVIISAVVIAVVLKAFVVDSRFVPTGSMIPTIHDGDRVIFLKLPYYFGKTPARQDVVVFASGDKLISDDDLLKRVIGLPGDTVEVKNGLVYVNDKALTEPYISAPRERDFGKVTVPEGCYFMMGDNRNHSTDSTMWNNPFVPFSDIKGKVLLCYWPISNWGIIE